jgi:hypothetical protein
MSTPRQHISVNRTYTSDADACLRAVSYLLKHPTSKKGARPDAPDDAEDLKLAEQEERRGPREIQDLLGGAA